MKRIHIRSFKLRIALLSVAVSGVALAVFGSLTLAAMQRLSLQRMDTDIKEFAHKHLAGPVGARHWEGLEAALRYFLRDEEQDTFLLLVRDRDGATLYASPNWPKELLLSEYGKSETWGYYAGLSSPPPPLDANDDQPAVNRETPSQQGRTRPPDRPSGRFFPAELSLKVPVFFTREASGVRWRIGVTGNPDTTLVLGLNMRRMVQEMNQVRQALLAVLPVSLLFVALGAWWISQRALKPIDAVTRTIKQVKAKGLNQRVSAQDEDREFSELINLFNDMMAWIEDSFRQAVRFSADASHELKTPLTVLQAQLEQAIHHAESGSDEQRRYVALGQELQRLKSITEKLLLLSRADAGELHLALRPLNLSELVEGIVEDTETLAPELEVQSVIDPDLWILADADLLKQVVQNLAANAIKYNQSRGFILFELHAKEQTLQLKTENSGPGIPAEERDKVFTRFYRGDKARSRHTGGAGLGLSLAREIARAHGGQLELAGDSSVTTCFLLTIPKLEEQDMPVQ